MEQTVAKNARRIAGNLVIDHRGELDIFVPAALCGAFVGIAESESLDVVLSVTGRSSMYTSLAATSGALLGFTLTALAILVALPSTDRLDALRRHPRWERVPAAFFRASWALLGTLVISTLGIVLDAGSAPAQSYEAVTVVFLALALVRVVGALVALAQVMDVARTTAPLPKPIDDPGP